MKFILIKNYQNFDFYIIFTVYKNKIFFFCFRCISFNQIMAHYTINNSVQILKIVPKQNNNLMKQKSK